MIKICKIIHIGSYVVKMRRWKYNQNYGQCYKCVFNEKFLCTQIYLMEAIRLCDICDAYAYPHLYEWNSKSSLKFIYKIETYAEKKM